MTEAEKLAEEYIDKEYSELKYEKCERKDFVFTFHEIKEMGKEAFLAGYEQGIGRLRYCCTCRHYLTCLGEDEETALYGICGDWEIKE